MPEMEAKSFRVKNANLEFRGIIKWMLYRVFVCYHPELEAFFQIKFYPEILLVSFRDEIHV